MTEPNKLVENGIRDATGKFVDGHPGGPGRPKGKTIKEQVREWLETHPQDNEDFVKHFIKKNRELAWQMLEGSPKGQTEHSGEVKVTPILGGLSKDAVHTDNSGSETLPTEETN